ncbi:hypothetical protein GH714_001369 [Hevea brasiliensis]|uniref:Disease resistance R13L4/SHOC-2-like LRR domain-containing protein n=1 Tax=Hevea brasiliensis TaxID=3981 RepID=A0A6A6LUA2_HEVBR|nr:hypothetical protein GH714_001369 [Hevea brasiliensis]
MSSLSAENSAQSNHSNNALTIPDIINSIPDLIHLLSKAKNSIPPPPSHTNSAAADAATTHGNNAVGSGLTSQPATENYGAITTDVSDGSVPLSTPATTTNDSTNVATGSFPRLTPAASRWQQQQPEQQKPTIDGRDGERKEIDGSRFGGCLTLGFFEKDKEQNDSSSKKDDNGQILKSVVSYIQQTLNGTNAFPTKQFHANIKAITDMVMKLKLQIPSPHKMTSATEGHRNIEAVSGLDARNLIDEMLQLPRMKISRWDNSSKKHTEDEETKRHIEVEGIEFLKGLKNMKYLKYLSLQGVSRVDVLPDTIWNLPNLRILDLNACHNLEALPKKIVSLENLTHLDISECYLLDYMPKWLGSLTKLQVLKGFVISDLKVKNYVDDLNALQRITALRKLTMVWGGKSLGKSGKISGVKKNLKRLTAFKRDNGSGEIRDTRLNPELPKDLEKLDLQCYPGTEAPSWLMPSKLECLQKLYIRGGKLCGLGQSQGPNDKWKVKILRVKYLSDLKMDWRELRDAFPDLVYLEKVKCPNLTFFPCDESGLWLNRNCCQIRSCWKN